MASRLCTLIHGVHLLLRRSVHCNGKGGEEEVSSITAHAEHITLLGKPRWQMRKEGAIGVVVYCIYIWLYVWGMREGFAFTTTLWIEPDNIGQVQSSKIKHSKNTHTRRRKCMEMHICRFTKLCSWWVHVCAYKFLSCEQITYKQASNHWIYYLLDGSDEVSSVATHWKRREFCCFGFQTSLHAAIPPPTQRRDSDALHAP